MIDTHLKLIFSGLAILLTFVAFVPYIRSILRGNTRPHVFSWFIWGITTVIVFFAQLEAQGGIGAWPIGLSGVVTVGVAVLAFLKRADISITRTDWVFFTIALASLPFWYLTSDPLWTVVVLTLVDLLGFGPTMRKAYGFPHQENQLFFLSFMLRNVFVILALEHYSITTVLFPLSIAVACSCLLMIVAYRRRVIAV
ncbi:hypothetical protein [Amphritea sp.]|uniref:hypothetical protein n=1 Tax=Amphritea sp. TaxID=1872502 RepID=UPI003A901BAD